MRILVVGATGAIGSRLVPALLEHGHDVVGTTRSPAKAEAIQATGARAEILDLLDHDAVMRTVPIVSPDVVVHEATALSQLSGNLRRLGRELEYTNRLRTQGTDSLLTAAAGAGAKRFVAQSFTGWTLAREGGPVKTEEDPFDPSPPRAMREAVEAFRHLERAVLDPPEALDGIVLRYGYLYGPGTLIAPGAPFVEDARRRKFPIVGRGDGVWSFVHIDDAVAATVAAIESSARGVYNVVDDEPAPVGEWLPALADAAGAPPPRTVPRAIARMVIGGHGVVMMTEVRGATNEKAKRDLEWDPVHKSWREGFERIMEGNGRPHPTTPS